MKKDDFYTAIEILSKHHTSKITINQPINNFVGELGQSKWTIHINHCVPAAINELVQQGSSLSMGEHGLSVSKY